MAEDKKTSAKAGEVVPETGNNLAPEAGEITAPTGIGAKKQELLDLGSIGLAIIGAGHRELTIDLRDLCVSGTFEEDMDTVFKLRHPSLMDRANIGLKYRKSLAGVNEIDMVTGDILWMFATLDTVCSKRPAWFNIELMSDAAFPIVSLLYRRFDDWVTDFRNSIGGSNKDNTTNQGNS